MIIRAGPGESSYRRDSKVHSLPMQIVCKQPSRSRLSVNPAARSAWCVSAQYPEGVSNGRMGMQIESSEEER
jgi:hypothetical protein